LSCGEADGADMAEAIEQLVSATVASLQAFDIDDLTVATEIGSRRTTTRAANAVAARRKKIGRPGKASTDLLR
jgi:hypothetical protein